MFPYTVECPNCRYEITNMWQTKIKRFDTDVDEQTLRCMCPICKRLYELKRYIKFGRPFSMKEIEIEKEE